MPGPQEFGSLRINRNTFLNLNKCVKIILYFSLGEVIRLGLLGANSERSKEFKINKKN